MSKLVRYTDWGTWWDGLRTNLLKCIGTTGTAWLGSNGLAASGIPGMTGIGLNWEQAIGLFGVHIAAEVFLYLKNNQPQVITETVETTHLDRDAAGVISSGSSKTVTTTPVQPTPPDAAKPTTNSKSYMKKIKILMASLVAMVAIEASAQTSTNAPASPTSALDFPATAGAWLTSIDYSKAWPTNEMDISVGALWNNNVSWCNFLGIQKNIGNIPIVAEMDNAGIAGTIYRVQAGAGYRLLNRGDLSVQATLSGGFDRLNRAGYVEPAITLRKQMAHGAFSGISLRYDAVFKGGQPSTPIIGIETGWTF